MSFTVSAVIPTYNNAAFLRATLDAVRAQTRPVDEIVLADDGSTDDTLAIAASYRDERIRILRLAHGGTASARLAGLRAATGDWVAWCDADDKWHPEKLAKQLSVSEGFDLIHTNANLVWDGAVIGDFWSANRIRPFRGGREKMASLFWRNPVVSASALVRRAPLLSAMNVAVQPGISMDVDYALWLNLLAAGGRFTYLPERLVDYRVHAAQQTYKRYSAKMWIEFMLQEFLEKNPAFLKAHPVLVRARMAKHFAGLAREFRRLSPDARRENPFPLRRAIRTVIAGRARWTAS